LQSARPAVFLDRDGTLIDEAGYLDRLERLVFYPYSVDAVRLLNRAGFAVVIVTNQAGVARGIFPETFVSAAHQYVTDRVQRGGARVDGFYYCPHHPDGTVPEYTRACDCRKPNPGLLKQAAADLNIDLTRSFAVGDRWHDLEAGQAVGARGVLVRTGYGWTEEASPKPGVTPAVIVDNLIAAASWILRAS
jgi:D-glycero-D-manno-heptose 1,7-bisphosphate phosphatase